MTREHDAAFIAGGTSGLGLELATSLRTKNNFEVYVTGRKKPEDRQLRFVYFDIDSHTDQLPHRIDEITSSLPQQMDI